MEASEPAEAPERKREKFGQFLQKSYNKSELAFKHSIGLGQTENIIPLTQPSTNGPPRNVEVGWHPVGGLAGKWFAEKTGLGRLITEKVHNYPDPTQHWAVLVGEYAHQLWMDENFDVIYTNARVDPKEWQTFNVGQTTFNDDALRRAGEAVIQNIRHSRPGYNLISNNCQTYVLQLLDAIQVSHVKEFGTTKAVYERLFGSGTVADLFAETGQGPGHAGEAFVLPLTGEQELGVIGGSGGEEFMPPHCPEATLHQGHASSGEAGQGSVSLAQQVMNANTTQLNTREQAQGRLDEDEHTNGGWGAKTTSFLRKLRK